jgi:hypothetical protein
MERLERFKKAVEYLKQKADAPTNEGVARLLRYGAENYISDVLGESKAINKSLLRRMVEFSISPDWIETGKGSMIIDKPEEFHPPKPFFIELKTASGKAIQVMPEGQSEIALLNAFLEERDRVLEERNRIIEKVEIEKQARIDELIKEKENLNNIIKQYLADIHSNSKEIVEDISALTDEIQAEHRAMMDSIDVAAGQPIGTTFAKSDSVEIASQQIRVDKDKKVVGKSGKQG